MQNQLRRNDLIEPELSYNIVGAIIDAYRELGSGLRESTYQLAISKELQRRGLKFRQQVPCPVYFKKEKVGTRRLDFLVEDKIIVELKCSSTYARSHMLQTKEYLEVTNLKLAIIATITTTGVRFKRVLNII